MKSLPLTLAGLGCSLALSANVTAQEAAVSWQTESPTYQAGKPLKVALHMSLAEGWHTYWSNPGQGGMKLSTRWTLPEGWTVTEWNYPAPRRFESGGLVNYGYKDTVVLLAEILPPAHASTDVSLEARFSWLTCNDDACVPGQETLSLTLSPGDSEAEESHRSFFDSASQHLPQERDNVSLELTDQGEILHLQVRSAASLPLDQARIYPLTPRVVDDVEPIRLVQGPSGEWTATVKRNEYAAATINQLDLVIALPEAERPLLLRWSGSSQAD